MVWKHNRYISGCLCKMTSKSTGFVLILFNRINKNIFNMMAKFCNQVAINRAFQKCLILSDREFIFSLFESPLHFLLLLCWSKIRDVKWLHFVVELQHGLDSNTAVSVWRLDEYRTNTNQEDFEVGKDRGVSTLYSREGDVYRF